MSINDQSVWYEDGNRSCKSDCIYLGLPFGKTTNTSPKLDQEVLNSTVALISRCSSFPRCRASKSQHMCPCPAARQSHMPPDGCHHAACGPHDEPPSHVANRAVHKLSRVAFIPIQPSTTLATRLVLAHHFRIVQAESETVLVTDLKPSKLHCQL